MKEIKSVNNDFIKYITKLKIKKYRDQENIYLIEGYHLIEMAKDKLKYILTINNEDIDKYGNCEYYLVTKEIMNKISQTQSPQGIIGVCYTNNKTLDDIQGNNVLVLDNVSDPGNLGTLIRSAKAFDFDTIILGTDCVDIYNDKVIRSTQGAIINSNIVCCDIFKAIEKLKSLGYTIISTALKNSISIKDYIFKDRNAIILGNEGLGVKDSVLESSDVIIKIPMNESMESLNVGVAGSIAMSFVYLNKK